MDAIAACICFGFRCSSAVDILGAFQILGEYHLKAGYTNVDLFVRAMCYSAEKQLDAFVSFIQADHRLLSAIREKNWQQFARFYNGGDYGTDHYDTRLADEYRKTTE